MINFLSDVIIDKALNDKHNYVRYRAIKHPNVTKDHIDKALNDEDWGVKYAASWHKKHFNV